VKIICLAVWVSPLPDSDHRMVVAALILPAAK
jgi:hypothetical protein